MDRGVQPYRPTTKHKQPTVTQHLQWKSIKGGVNYENHKKTFIEYLFSSDDDV